MKVIKKEVNIVYDLKDVTDQEYRVLIAALEFVCYHDRGWRGRSSAEQELIKKLRDVN